MKTPRPSAAVLLTRGDGPSLEVYLVLRSKLLRFFGGYWAFPGGVLDENDRVESASSGLTSGEGESGARDRARCARRELFEETGVLLSERGTSDEIAAVRRALLSGETGPWRELIGRVGEHPAGLRFFASMTTPPFTLERYHTSFFHAELSAGEKPCILAGELDGGHFFRPDELLRAWSAGELLVAPPVLFLIGLLRGGSLEQGLARAGAECRRIDGGRLHSVRQTPGIFVAPLATPTLPPATTTNCYLVGEGEVYVVDPATWEEGERARLFEIVDEWVAEGRRIGGVLATHHHADHIGSLEQVAERYGAPVLAHRETLARLPRLAIPSRELADGDRLDLGRAPDGSGDWTLEVYHTPGHARGHLAFVESRYRSAIVGDLVSTLSTIVIDPPEGHLATYLSSLERLLDLRIGVLHPAHGLPQRDGPALVLSYLAHRAERERKLVAALGSRSRPVAELVPEVYADTDPGLWPLASRSLEAGLIKLEEEGRARRAGERWELGT